jgi:uncharacterized membrane protein YhaH (DUF805 family)
MTDTELQQKRLIAAAIDGGIAVGVMVVMVIVAIVAGFISPWLYKLVMLAAAAAQLAYVLARDVIAGDRSLGKKTQEIKVVMTTGAPVTLVDSVKRNAILGIGSAVSVVWALVAFVPFLGCLVTPLLALGSLAGMAAVIIEIVKVIQDPAGVRFGDQFASTRVTR